jgi:hypothetical protein
MPEEKKDEMGVGCVVVARERPTTRDGVVVAITARSWVTRSRVRSRYRQHGRTFFGSALIAKRARRTDWQLEQQLQCELQLSRRA